MAVGTHPPHGYWDQAGLAWLSFAMLAGPLALTINLGAGYALVKWACASGHAFVLTALSLGTLALALAGTWVGWRCRAQLPGANEHGGRIVDRSYFVAIVAIGFSLLNALLVTIHAYATVVLSPCE
jgi:hypothetical protein